MQAPGSAASAAIRSFASALQRRRRALPVMISIAPPDIDLNPDLTHRFKVTTQAASARRDLDGPDDQCNVKATRIPFAM
jgi:hypothetical protein